MDQSPQTVDPQSNGAEPVPQNLSHLDNESPLADANQALQENTGQQQQHHSTDGQQEVDVELRHLMNEATMHYGMNASLLDGKKPEEIRQLMIEQDNQALYGRAPYGMNGGYQQQQPPQQYGYQQQQQPFEQQQQYQQQQYQQMPAPQDQNYKPDWSDENLFDPEQAKAMQYMDQQMQQMQQMIQQQQQQHVQDQFLQSVDGLDSDAFGTADFRTPQQHSRVEQLAATASALSVTNPNLSLNRLVQRAARLLNSQSQQVGDPAQIRNGQISGSPNRTGKHSNSTPAEIVRSKLAEYGSVEGGGLEDDLDAFL